MKVVILAGGLGTRLTEETQLKPKPMVEIGGRPVLWHLMKSYSHYGFNDFVICLGYKGYLIKEFFSNYFLHTSDITFDLSKNKMKVHQVNTEKWKVTLVDTGDGTQTGGRLKRVKSYLGNEDFCFTYGDGLSDVNIRDVVKFHKKQKTMATLVSVQPPGRFGALSLDGHKITEFREKPDGDGGWINGGFFVLSPKSIDYISGDQTVWEKASLERLANDGQLSAFRHNGFWRPMDTLRDKLYLEDLWSAGRAPWKVWS
jgi:glucose-1-phosphate cytidylyltransferase